LNESQGFFAPLIKRLKNTKRVCQHEKGQTFIQIFESFDEFHASKIVMKVEVFLNFPDQAEIF